MSTPKSKVLKLSLDRVAQLDELREHIRGGSTMSYNALVGELLQLARAAYPLKREVPGVLVNRIPAGVQIFFDGRPNTGLTAEGALALADAIRAYLASPTGARVSTNAPDLGFNVAGRALTVAVSVPADAEPVLFTHDIARDLADLLERTAKSEPESADA